MVNDGASKRLEVIRTSRGSALRSILVYVNLFIVTALTLGLAGVTKRVVDTETEKMSIEGRLRATQSSIEQMTRENEMRIRALIDRQGSGRETSATSRRDIDKFLDSMSNRLSSLESSSQQSKFEAVSSVRREIDALRSSLSSQLADVPSPDRVFREFEARHEGGVVLIYTEFDYKKIREGKEVKTKTVSGWGSGFFVGDQGHIVTNKHVVQPWKFDADIATMVALGEIRIDESSVRIAAWETGMRAFDKHGDPDFDHGYNNTVCGNLEVYSVAQDHMNEHTMDIGIDGPKYRMHDLDNNDLVILKVSGRHGRPLPCATADEVQRLEKLSPIMALGFPRGQNGLERGVVETSPSVGTIRKVENTIHVTASIIPGNSGGPLIGPDGKVIGIVTRIYSETLGICIKIEHAQRLIEIGRLAERARATAIRAIETVAR